MMRGGMNVLRNGETAAGPAPAAWEPTLVAFCCGYCADAAAALAGSRRLQYPAGVRILPVPCTGKLEMENILEAFEKGADGVLVFGCPEGDCHFVEGNLRARRRTDRIREMLDEIGLGSRRLRMVNLSDSMAVEFVREMREMTETIRRLGPNPLRDAEQGESRGRS